MSQLMVFPIAIAMLCTARHGRAALLWGIELGLINLFICRANFQCFNSDFFFSLFRNVYEEKFVLTRFCLFACWRACLNRIWPAGRPWALHVFFSTVPMLSPILFSIALIRHALTIHIWLGLAVSTEHACHTSQNRLELSEDRKILF